MRKSHSLDTGGKPEGVLEMAIIVGNAQGVDDFLIGTKADDVIRGLSGDDFINGGGGNDTIIGGAGSDVLNGGTGADEFQWSAGHISDGATDYVRDFSINAGDTFNFLDSFEAEFEVLAITRAVLSETEFNGIDLHNGMQSTDIIITVMNAATGATQNIVLLDSWSNSLNDKWEDYLASKDLAFTDVFA